MEGYRQSLLTTQSAEASEELLLRQAGAWRSLLLEVDEVDVPPLTSFAFARHRHLSRSGHIFCFISIQLLVAFCFSRREDTP